MIRRRPLLRRKSSAGRKKRVKQRFLKFLVVKVTWVLDLITITTPISKHYLEEKSIVSIVFRVHSESNFYYSSFSCSSFSMLFFRFLCFPCSTIFPSSTSLCHSLYYQIFYFAGYSFLSYCVVPFAPSFACYFCIEKI